MICTQKTLNQSQASCNREYTVKQKKQLIARWKTVNGKLVCQWISS